MALVEGVVREGNGTLESRLVEDRDFRVRPTRDFWLGKRAITHYRVSGQPVRFESPIPAGFRRAVAGLAS